MGEARDVHPATSGRLSATSSAELARSNARLSVLAQASRTFAELADSPALLHGIAATAAELVGDGCLVKLLDAESGQLRNTASAHREAELAAAWNALLAERQSSRAVGDSIVAAVARSGIPQLMADVLPDESACGDDELKPMFSRLNVHSFAAVPIRARGTTLGTLALVRSRPSASYTREDLSLLQELADRAGLAVANARRYEEARVRGLKLEAANDELRCQEMALRRCAAIIECSSDAIVSTTFDAQIVTWNPAAERLLGYPASEMIGRHVSNIVPLERRSEAEDWSERVRQGEHVKDSDTVRLRKDGTAVEVSMAIAPILDDSGAVCGGTAIIRDISERRKLERHVLLAERMASVGMLAAGVAHEINNPLSYVLGNVELALDRLPRAGAATEQDNLALAPLLTEARDGALRIARIVRGLRAFSRSDEERRDLLSLPAILDTALSLVQNEISHRAQVLKKYGQAPLVSGDEGRLVQVFVNLLVNAAHALPDDPSAAGEIEVVIGSDPAGRAFVEVRDSGAGIAEAERGRVFDAFYTTKPVGMGTGLGLSICHGIVTAHQGEITLASELGKGTTFRVVLPAAPSSAEPGSAEPPTPASVPPTIAARAKVMVIDDEPIIGRLFHALLVKEHDVTVCQSGREALSRFHAGERFDVILCDLIMPKVTGMDVYAEIQRLAPEQATRIVFMTGGAFTLASRAFLDAVPNRRIDKPCDARVLQELVRELVSGASDACANMPHRT